MRFTVVGKDGGQVEFECSDTLVSRWVCGEILEGKTYPVFRFVDDVQVVFDVGANCGAATVHFARASPYATVHSFEPARQPLAVLRRNAAEYRNVHIHGFGLHERDEVVPLYKGDGDSILASVVRASVNVDESEPVALRAAGPWAAEQGIARIDVLKVDVELCELAVLTSLSELLPTVKVLYVEYDARDMRRAIAGLVAPTHQLFAGSLFLDQGECIYIRNDYVERDAARSVPADRGRALADVWPSLPFVGDVREVWEITREAGGREHLRALYPGADIRTIDPEQWASTTSGAPGLIDVLQIDVDDVRPEALKALSASLRATKVIYARNRDAATLRDLERLISDSHDVYLGQFNAGNGSAVFLRRDLAARDAAAEHLRAIVRAQWTTSERA